MTNDFESFTHVNNPSNQPTGASLQKEMVTENKLTCKLDSERKLTEAAFTQQCFTHFIHTLSQSCTDHRNPLQRVTEDAETFKINFSRSAFPNREILCVDIVEMQIQFPAFLGLHKKHKMKVYPKDVCQSFTLLPVIPGSVGSAWGTIEEPSSPLGLETVGLLIVLFPL